MSLFISILRSLSALTGLTRATTRLIRAAKETEPPPPLPQDPAGAEQYLRGQNNARFNYEEAQRLEAIGKQLLEPFEPEKPEEEKP